MGCDSSDEIRKKEGVIRFTRIGPLENGLDLYGNENPFRIFFEAEAFICPLCDEKFPENEEKEIKSLKRNGNGLQFFNDILLTALRNYSPSYCEEKLAEFEKMIEEEEKYLKKLYYIHKCNKTNKEVYLKPYGLGLSFGTYIRSDYSIFNNLLSLERIIDRNKKKNEEDDNYGDGKISKSGYFRGKKLCGKVEVVDCFPDFKVQVVDCFPDLKVQKVDCFPDEIGKWEFVDHFPDFKIQYVDCCPDFKIQFVDCFPGVC